MATKKMTKKEMQDILRGEAVKMLNAGEALENALLVGANEYALRIPGESIGLENQDCWVCCKLVVKNFQDTETQEAYDAQTEAELYADEVTKKEKEKAAKKAEKEKKAAADKARREAKKAEKEAKLNQQKEGEEEKA